MEGWFTLIFASAKMPGVVYSQQFFMAEQSNFQSLRSKLQKIDARFRELEELIQKPEVISNSGLYSQYMKERGSLLRLMTPYRELQKIEEEIQGLKQMLANEIDAEVKELEQQEIQSLEKTSQEIYEKIQDALISDDETDQKNAIIELRAGTGGEEAALFARELYEMYIKFAERKHWKVEILDSDPSDLGGLKEIIFSIKGKDVYKYMKFESGGHRVQRIPVTESAGRIHTSACSVAVLPEAEEVEVDIKPGDLKIDTLRASGPGGQNVNKTSSAVRITHLPTGIVVKCQDTPEQYKNKMKAMRILRSRLLQRYQQEQHDKRNELRRSQQLSGERSDRIRTYNYPQNRVTDHRINVSIYDLPSVMQGQLEEFVMGLYRQEREQLIKQFQEEV